MGSSKQEELRRDIVKVKLDGSSSSGSKPKEEEDNAALTSKGQQEQRRHKEDISNVEIWYRRTGGSLRL